MRWYGQDGSTLHWAPPARHADGPLVLRAAGGRIDTLEEVCDRRRAEQVAAELCLARIGIADDLLSDVELLQVRADSVRWDAADVLDYQTRSGWGSPEATTAARHAEEIVARVRELLELVALHAREVTQVPRERPAEPEAHPPGAGLRSTPRVKRRTARPLD